VVDLKRFYFDLQDLGNTAHVYISYDSELYGGSTVITVENTAISETASQIILAGIDPSQLRESNIVINDNKDVLPLQYRNF
jgi:hypothetical protein